MTSGRGLPGDMRHLIRQQVDNVARVSPSFMSRRLDTIGRPSFVSHSFYGEDAVVHGYLRRWSFEGFIPANYSYIDIGAWRPVQGSNSYWLYERGARGTLVEPNEHLAKLLMRARPGDEALPVACGESSRMEFYSFGPYSESNTTSLEFAREIESTQGRLIKKAAPVSAQSLGEILSNHRKNFGDPLLLSIDAEGRSMEILTSVDWTSDPSRPYFIITEVDEPVRKGTNGGLGEFLGDLPGRLGYRLAAVCGVSVILVRADYFGE